MSRALLTVVAGLGLAWMAAMAASGEAARSAYLVPVVLTLAAVASLALPARLRFGAAVTLLLLAPLPWLIEYVLTASDREAELRRQYASRLGVVYDGRTVVQIVSDLRAEGHDAWPATYPRKFTPDTAPPLLDENGQRLQPLGGISDVDTVHGNEEGRYLVYRSDEHGFHNPPGIWNLPEVDVLAVGDSFTHGSSVPTGRNMIAAVRRRWPATLNLGYGGNGPLMELASLFEYGPQRRPRIVLWVLCEANDVGEDLQREKGSELLMRYWEERRPLQDLEGRQGEIDGLLREHVEAMRRSAMAEASAPKANPQLSLERVRKTATTTAAALTKVPPDQWDVLTDILRVAKETTAGWGGELYLVYLPVHYALTDRPRAVQTRGTPEQRRQHAIETGRLAGVPVIDLEPVFLEAGPRAAEFVYPYRGHFTAIGYEALGDAIVDRLEADGHP